MDQNRIRKPLAVITAASSGAGLDLAREFAQRGFDLVMVAADPGIYQAASMMDQYGVVIRSYQIDLTYFHGVESLYEHLVEMHRPVDLLAINSSLGEISEFNLSVENELMEAELGFLSLNLTSAVHLCRRLSSSMIARGHGRILFTTLADTEIPSPLMDAQVATKAFLKSYINYVRKQFSESGMTLTSHFPEIAEESGTPSTRISEIFVWAKATAEMNH